MPQLLKRFLDFILKRYYLEKIRFKETKIDKEEPDDPDELYWQDTEELDTISIVNILEEVIDLNMGKLDDMLDSTNTEESPPTKKLFLILDAGHGPRTTNRRIAIKEQGGTTVYQEHDFNKAVVDHAKKLLLANKIDFIDTRDLIAQELQVPVKFLQHGNAVTLRTRVINKFLKSLDKDKYFPIVISQHANGFNIEQAHGREVWVASKYINTDKEFILKIASVLNAQYGAVYNNRDRKIKYKEEEEFYILKHTNCFVLLGEPGFYSNPTERSILFNPKYMRAYGESILKTCKLIQTLINDKPKVRQKRFY